MNAFLMSKERVLLSYFLFYIEPKLSHRKKNRFISFNLYIGCYGTETDKTNICFSSF
jgi:hypothetical protein